MPLRCPSCYGTAGSISEGLAERAGAKIGVMKRLDFELIKLRRRLLAVWITVAVLCALIVIWVATPIAGIDEGIDPGVFARDFLPFWLVIVVPLGMLCCVAYFSYRFSRSRTIGYETSDVAPALPEEIEGSDLNELSREEKCIAELQRIGYRVKVKKSAWVVREPLGGTVKLESLDKLDEYTQSR